MPDSYSDSSNAPIDLWLTWYDQITDPILLENMAQLMSETERAQQARYHFADDRLRYLVTRALVRTVLSRYGRVHPAEWEFRQNPYGRPFVAAHQAPAGVHFNISHCKGLIALAVARGIEVGVDVENMLVRRPSLDIASHFLAPSEVAQLHAIPEALQHERFFEFWTFKESYIKARGLGLSLPLDCFSFDLSQPGHVRLSVDAAIGGDADHWDFWQCKPTSAHVLALCAQRREARLQPPRVRSLVPGLEALTCDIRWMMSPRLVFS